MSGSHLGGGQGRQSRRVDVMLTHRGKPVLSAAYALVLRSLSRAPSSHSEISIAGIADGARTINVGRRRIADEQNLRRLRCDRVAVCRDNGVVVSFNHRLYGDISRRMNEVYQRFASDIEIYSSDESLLDLSSVAKEQSEELGRELRSMISTCALSARALPTGDGAPARGCLRLSLRGAGPPAAIPYVQPAVRSPSKS